MATTMGRRTVVGGKDTMTVGEGHGQSKIHGKDDAMEKAILNRGVASNDAGRQCQHGKSVSDDSFGQIAVNRLATMVVK